MQRLKWLADECFDNDIVRGLYRRVIGIDLIRAQDIPEVSGRSDAVLIEWAAAQDRIILTHDISSMHAAIEARRSIGGRLPTVVFAPDRLAVGDVIDDISLLDACAEAADLVAGFVFLPLR